MAKSQNLSFYLYYTNPQCERDLDTFYLYLATYDITVDQIRNSW